jgi:hypothetical protein
MSFGSTSTPVAPKKLANISGYDTSSNQQGVCVPYFAGEAKIALSWISPFYNLTGKPVSSGGGKKVPSSSTQKNWYADIAGVACVCPDDAPVDAVLFVLVNDEVAFTGPLNRSGGAHYAALTLETYCQEARVYWGTKDQPRDTLILTMRGVPPVGGGFNSRNTSTFPKFDTAGDPWVLSTPPPGVPNPQAGHYDLHPAYPNCCYFVFKQFFLGSSPNMPNVQVIMKRGCKFFSGARFESDPAGGVNPMGPLYELLTDDLFGAGLPEAELSAASFEAAATSLTADGILLSPLLLSATSLRAFISDYLGYFDGFLRRNGTLLEAGYFSHGAIDTGALLTLGSDDATTEFQVQPGTLEDTKNFFTVQFTNRDTWYYNDFATSDDPSNFNQVGEQRDDAPSRPFIITAAGAQRFITEYGQMLARIGASGTQEFRREKVASLLPGDRFNNDSAIFGLELLLRIINVEWPADKDSTAKLTLSVERADWQHLYTQPAAPKDPDFKISAIAIAAQRIVELPSQLKNANAIEVAVLAERPSAPVLGFRTHVSKDNVTYDIVQQQTFFAVHGKIKTAAYVATTPIVDASVGMVVELYGVDLESIVSQSDQQRDDHTLLVWVDNEIMSVGLVTALGSGRYRVYLKRSCYGTGQALHAIDADCWFVFRDHLAPIANANFIPGDTVYFKLQPYTATENYDTALVAAIAHVFGAGPFVLSGLELFGQGSDFVFTGRNPRFAWRLFSIAGAEISGEQLSLGAYDDQFAQFNLRVRDAGTGDVVWTGTSKVPERIFEYEENARCAGGKRRHFFFGAAALARSGEQTPWEEIEVNNPNEDPPSGHVGGGITSIDFYLDPSTALDHAGTLLWRSLDPAFTVTEPLAAGVELVFKGPDSFFSVPQAEGTTWYYRSASYDDFWDGTLADLIIGDPVPLVTITVTPTGDPPPISEGSQSFTGTKNVSVSPPAGMTVRYSFNKDALSDSAEWPGGIGSYTALAITQSCTLYWRGYLADGTPTKQGSAVFTLVASGAGTPSCGSVAWRVASGTPGHTSINLALACATSGSTIHYRKNGGALTTYVGVVTLALDDSIEFYASASGYSDSPVDFYENTDLTH